METVEAVRGSGGEQYQRVDDGFYFVKLAEDVNRAEAEDVILGFETALSDYCGRNGMLAVQKRDVYDSAVTNGLYFQTRSDLSSIEGWKSILDGQMEGFVEYREIEGRGEVYLEAELPFKWEGSRKKAEFEELLEDIKDPDLRSLI